ncbi:amidase domain-containing protein [Paenibacillus sp. HB172176]|uniref:amidase domain-containing protein n=1 Tax=Paenibacillus sp. HB172176 TaxID=2493690 RepID=UPI001F112029|nr:amidase domain-containing protein [Paenibacillus sp. HB172176]
MSKAGGRMPNRQRHKRNIRQAMPGTATMINRRELVRTHAVRPHAKLSLPRKKKPEHPIQLKLSSILETSDSVQSALLQKTQAKDWQSLVHQYVNRYNQAETEQHARVLSDFVTDDIHNERLGSRLARLRERDLLRGALTAGSETKAKIMRLNEASGELTLLLQLHVSRRMEQNGLYYKEERLETERLWLSRFDKQWAIVKVEPVIAERRPRYGSASQQWVTEHDAYPEETGTKTPSMPYLNYDLMRQFKHRPIPIQYRRELAAEYADRWWNEGNPAYELFDVNCTNYVSQCIFAGNAPMNYTDGRGSGWWYKGRNKGQELWSYSWAVSHALMTYLTAARKSGLRATMVQSADELELGDVITYDWNGDNRYQHSTIVTAFDAAGQPLVNANTVASRHRYWDYQDSYAWTPQTKYRFFHLSDTL